MRKFTTFAAAAAVLTVGFAGAAAADPIVSLNDMDIEQNNLLALQQAQTNVSGLYVTNNDDISAQAAGNVVVGSQENGGDGFVGWFTIGNWNDADIEQNNILSTQRAQTNVGCGDCGDVFGTVLVSGNTDISSLAVGNSALIDQVNSGGIDNANYTSLTQNNVLSTQTAQTNVGGIFVDGNSGISAAAVGNAATFDSANVD